MCKGCWYGKETKNHLWWGKRHNISFFFKEVSCISKSILTWWNPLTDLNKSWLMHPGLSAWNTHPISHAISQEFKMRCLFTLPKSNSLMLTVGEKNPSTKKNGWPIHGLCLFFAKKLRGFWWKKIGPYQVIFHSWIVPTGLHGIRYFEGTNPGHRPRVEPQGS